jgi:Mn2+/Fe2+ NRAMP family transporter
MKRALSLTLGILTAIGGFIDIGDLVSDALIGARFGLGLAWVTLVAVFGIMTYAEMSARVAAVAGLPAYDVVRSRMSPVFSLLSVTGSFLATMLALIAELAGVALAIELLSGTPYLVWGSLGHQILHPPLPTGEGLPTYFFFAVVMLGAQMTPYEIIFFSSSAVEKRWTVDDLSTARLNVFVGFPLGGLLAVSIQAVAAIVYFPIGVEVDHLSQTVLPVSMALGKVGLAIALLGIVAATIGATLETLMSSSYAISQYSGWSWGKSVRRVDAARFNTLLIALLVIAAAIGLTTINPITVTIYAVFFGALVLPFTFVPVLIAANDERLMGDHRNGRLANTMGTIFLFVTVVASLAALPLLIATKAGL